MSTIQPTGSQPQNVPVQPDASPVNNSIPVSGSDGSYIVTGADGKPMVMDLASMVMMLALRRTENLDTQIGIKTDEVKEANGKIAKFTEAMAICRQYKTEGLGCDCMVTFDGKRMPVRMFLKEELGIEVLAEGKNCKGSNGRLQPPQEYNGVRVKDVKPMAVAGQRYSVLTLENGKTVILDPRQAASVLSPESGTEKNEWEAKWDATIHGVKTIVDDITTELQEHNSKLENLMQKRSNAFSSASKMLDTDSEAVRSTLDKL